MFARSLTGEVGKEAALELEKKAFSPSSTASTDVLTSNVYDDVRVVYLCKVLCASRWREGYRQIYLVHT